MSKQDYSEVIYQALTVLTEEGATDHKRFLALMRDLSVDYPTQMKFLQHNSDAKYLQICSRALRAGDQELPMIRAEAVAYLESEFSSSANPANSMTTYMIKAYAAYGRHIRPTQVSIPNIPKKPEKPPANPGGTPEKRPSGNAGKSTSGNAGNGTGGKTTNTTGKTGSSSDDEVTAKDVVTFIITVLVCIGIWHGYGYYFSGNVGGNEESEALLASKETFTHHLNEIQFDTPVNCSERHAFDIKDEYSIYLNINADVPAVERTTPVKAASEDKKEQKGDGYEILDTGKVKIQDGPISDDHVTCRFIESEKDDQWRYKLFVPVEDKQCITVVEISDYNDYPSQGKKLRDELLEDIEVNKNELYSSNRYEAGGLQFSCGDLRHSSSYYTYHYRNGKRPILNVSVATPYSSEGAFMERHKDLDSDIKYSQEQNDDKVYNNGIRMIDGHSGYWYGYKSGETFYDYKLYLDRTDTWEEDYQTYRIDVDLDFDYGQEKAKKKLEKFLDTVKFND